MKKMITIFVAVALIASFGVGAIAGANEDAFANAVIDADNNVGIQIIETMPANEEEYQHPEVDKDLQIEAEAEAEKEAEEAAAKKAKAAKKAAKVQESDDNAEADEASEKEEN